MELPTVVPSTVAELHFDDITLTLVSISLLLCYQVYDVLGIERPIQCMLRSAIF